MKVLLAIVLITVAMVCGYGLLASFEYPGVTGWKVGYASVGLLSLLIALRTLYLANVKQP